MMFKLTLVIALCIVVIAECKPAQDDQLHRVARQSIPNPLSAGADVANQMATAMAQAAKKAVDVGQQAVQGMTGMAQTGMSMIPGMSQG